MTWAERIIGGAFFAFVACVFGLFLWENPGAAIFLAVVNAIGAAGQWAGEPDDR